MVVDPITTEHIKFQRKAHWGKIRQVKRVILPAIQGKNVLDFGCGTGGYTKLLASAANEVMAYDVNEVKLELAASVNGAGNITYTSQFPTGHFDVAVFLSVLEYIPNWQEVYDKIDADRKFIICPDYRGGFHWSLPRLYLRTIAKQKQAQGWKKGHNPHFNEQLVGHTGAAKPLHFTDDIGIGKNSYLYTL